MLSALIPMEVANWVGTLTSGYAPLGVGLIGLTWFSAGMITWMAIRHYWEDAHLEIPPHPAPVHRPSHPSCTEQAEYLEAA